MTSWKSFYDIVDLEDGFGSMKNRATPHRGLDCPRGGGTAIPAFLPGEVVVNQWSSVLGWVVVIKVNSRLFIGYCHQLVKSPLEFGQQIGQGQTIGKVGNTGSASRGNHLHFTAGTEMTSVFYGAAMDPWPYLKATLDSSTLAGSTEKELPDMDATERSMLTEVHAALAGGRPGIAGTQTFIAKGKIRELLEDIQAKTLTVYNEVTPGSKGVKEAGGIYLSNMNTEAQLKTLVAQNTALTAALKALAIGEGADPQAIEAAAQKGAAAALAALKITISK